MRKAGRILLAAALTLGAASTAAAQAQGDAPPPAKTRTKAKPKTAAKPAPKAADDALPCARAQYRNDPACFGENDPARLPLPSAGSGAAAPARAEDPTITAKTKLNETNRDPILGNNPNPHPSDNQFGGSLGLGFHF